MKNLLVEIGNTALKAAWCEEKTLGKIFRYQGERPLEYLLSISGKDRPEVLTVSSVNGISEKEEELLRKECGSLVILDRNHTEILSGYGLPEYLSYDRAAGAVAASYLFKGKPCTVFDFGTTLSVDFLDAEGKYLGGNISPGCRTRFKSLNRYSKNIPLVDTPEEIQLAGSSIGSSVGAGVVLGIMFEIEGYMRLHPDNVFVFTGGDAAYFAKKTKTSVFVTGNLVLMGLAIITDDYVRKNLQ